MSAIDTTDLEPTGYPSTEGLLDVPDPCDDLLTALLKSEKRAYRRGVRDGKKAKPLRWRTGLVPKKDRDGLYLVRTITPDYYLLGGHTINGSTRCDAWLPLSEILELIGE